MSRPRVGFIGLGVMGEPMAGHLARAGYALELMAKDVGIALELADREGLPLPLSALGRDLWKTAAREADPGASISEMVRWVEHMTGTEITREAAL